MTIKEMYCNKCRRRKAFKKIGSRSLHAGTGPCRVALAVMSLGFSEYSGREYFWQCTTCNEVIKRD